MRNLLQNHQIMSFYNLLLIIHISTACIGGLFAGISGGSQGKCYGDLGCFPTDGDFYDPVYRPISVSPQPPEEINTTFHLFTQKNLNTEQFIFRTDPESISNSNFDYQKPVKFITHGFTDGIASGWMINISKLILDIDDVNVIIVDWSKGANDVARYDLATANTRLVGREIGNLIKLMQDKFGVKYEDVHITGHSLGAHVGGYAGKWLNATVLGQITGLDAAGIFFENMPPSVRLDPADALFVDVIHTNGRKIPYTSSGIYNPSGHIDFYPDGGKTSETCEPEDVIQISLSNIPGGLRNIVACSHTVSIDMYIQSINKSNPFTAYACDSIESYNEAKCYTCDNPGPDCRPMGYYTNQYDHNGLLNEKFFLTTADNKSSLCAFHWVIEIEISKEQQEVSGNFYLSAKGKMANLTKQKLNNSPETISPEKTYRYLLTFEKDPIEIKAITFSWTKAITDILAPEDKVEVTTLTLIPIDDIDQSQRKDNTVEFCDDSLLQLKSNNEVTVKPQSNCAA